ncbi:MAG: glucan biosynthesis protein, partial [Chthoniobacterales bacterium]|nr:glucan biosynthesis protein [Chthoniobacterales bacterium]
MFFSLTLTATSVTVLTSITTASSQTWLRGTVTFEKLVDRAQTLAGKNYVPPAEDALPDWMQKLTYDQYRDIRFDPKKALWIGEGIPFRCMFFHPGYLFKRPVEMWEFTDSHQQRIRLSEEFFTYGPLIEKHGPVPPEVGFAGVRLHTPLNTPDYYDELIVFQGASYWRALGKGQRYGISSRGIAVNTGLAGIPEEFPDFRAFWLRKPSIGDDHAHIYALLDGPSVTGAYEFKIYPGEDTVVDVRMVVFLRKDVLRLGIAPMSSMYWFGENSRRRFDDYRPEVHDSDGL